MKCLGSPGFSDDSGAMIPRASGSYSRDRRRSVVGVNH